MIRKWYDKLAEWLVGFGIEAYLHILMTMVVAWVLARVSYATGADRILAGYLGAFVAFILGFIKESWDNKVEGVFEGKDILCNFIGALFFFLIWV